ncbi:MAG TPA: hypothetical protein VEH06_01725 [Candidatus Bathyarchaeia archaeon]|nr:hypothetical protein [Candidatus Bathyarchaeia archaeon]
MMIRQTALIIWHAEINPFLAKTKESVFNESASNLEEVICADE